MTQADLPRVSGSRRVLRRLLRHRTGVVGLVLSALFVLVALAAPVIAPVDPAAVDFDQVLQQPSLALPLGSDELGRDQLARVIYGIRASIVVGVLSVLLAVVVAVPLGLIAGYYRGFADTVVSRLTDTLLAFPFLVLAVGLAAVLGASMVNAAIAIGLSQVPNLIRVMRGEALRLAGEDYVAASVAAGARGTTAMFRHILPNAVNALLIQITVAIPLAIIGEALLSFLGLGVQPPEASLGVMLSAAQTYLAQAPWLVVFPGLAVVLATLAFNLLGDGLRDALDPKGQR
ncbi:peptide/nickel transport system permease protein [Saccharopolyspora shandongensis]|uniref:Peptide/nickel transport system permease protein n=1 Tax=Saccharopolyspora shandongensis TaxID=418495 RepID=A0A1H2UKF9_9PSEU|nr:ABC transporter permease [Saccharopolyspora shandongensis]SDW56582.1 peptide/nickel transport system permease protein [Saccharopolyspora shandongensis]